MSVVIVDHFVLVDSINSQVNSRRKIMSKKNKAQAMADQIEKDKLEEKRKSATTELYLNCRGHATMVLSKLHGSEFNVVTVLERLSRSVDRVLNNDTNEIEAMLMTQAKTLEYVFYDALSKLPSSSMERAEVCASIALKAQSGCRKTLMALAEIKHPRRTTTFIKQQNNHAVNQQVNNSVKSESENNKKIANELNAKVTYETKVMDIGTTIATGTANTSTETVGVFNRSKDNGG